MEGWKEGRMDGWMDKRMGGLTDGRMTEGMGGWMDGWMDRQTDFDVIRYEDNQMF